MRSSRLPRCVSLVVLLAALAVAVPLLFLILWIDREEGRCG